MPDVKALRHAMLDADCTVHELAAACELSTAAFYRRLNGSVSFTLNDINHCVARLGLSTDARNQIFFAENVS